MPLVCALGATLVFVRAAPSAGTSAVELEQRLVIASTEQFLPDGEAQLPLSDLLVVAVDDWNHVHFGSVGYRWRAGDGPRRSPP